MTSQRPCPSMRPNQCSLLECRRRGWWVEHTEHTLKATGLKKDFGGILDHVAIGPDFELLDSTPICWGIQSTTRDHISDHVLKIVNSPTADWWLRVPSHKLVIWGWGMFRGTYKLKEVRMHRLESGVIVRLND